MVQSLLPGTALLYYLDLVVHENTVVISFKNKINNKYFFPSCLSQCFNAFSFLFLYSVHLYLIYLDFIHFPIPSHLPSAPAPPQKKNLHKFEKEKGAAVWHSEPCSKPLVHISLLASVYCRVIDLVWGFWFFYTINAGPSLGLFLDILFFPPCCGDSEVWHLQTWSLTCFSRSQMMWILGWAMS